MVRQLMPKKKRTFIDWVLIRGIMNKEVGILFTVPTHLDSLPCGCKRDVKNDQPFRVKLRDGKLIHHYWKENGFKSCVLVGSEDTKPVKVPV